MNSKKFNFVHFRLHTEYSFHKSIVKIENIIKLINKDNQHSVCITDSNNIYGAIKFYKECLKYKIKPIIGCDLNINFQDESYNLILVIKNKKGYYNICNILSKIFLYKNKFIKPSWLKGELSKGLVFILNLNFKKSIYFKKIKNIILFFLKIFKNNFYLEIQKFNKNKNYKKIIKFSKFFNVPLIPTNPIYFIKKNDFKYCLCKIKIYKKINFIKNIKKNNYLYKKKKILKLFKDIRRSIKNTLELSKKCNLIINFNKIKLPFFKINKYNNNFYILKILKKKIKNKKRIYKKRLMMELKVILTMGLSDYFLMVYDFIRWSKKKKIMIGPGRGSSAGSLVSYLLNITEIDPIKHNLLFERFLNSERISIPDFDVDVCQEDREKVFDYIKKKYGLSFVANIITFTKMGNKASIKDIGKFLRFNYDFMNEINKILYLNNNINILEFLKKNKDFYFKYKKNKKVKKLLSLYFNLEGLVKNIGIHSGGLIISFNKIFNYMPLNLINYNIISHFCKDDLEEKGLLKFDILGLATLTIIKKCLKSIKKNIEFKKIKLNDKKCYKNLSRGDTICVFQLESFGIRKVLKKIKPLNFQNIVAIISLYRPGPIKLIDDFYLKKSGKKKVIYFDKKLKKILKETYGIIVYQEQIMEIVKKIGGYSLNEADNLRRIISKKKIEEMEKEKIIFIKKSLMNGLKYKKALRIFNIIKEFANYGFNKSHACAYSLLSYFTLWLKSHYKCYFFSSNLSYYNNDDEKKKIIIKDCIINNIYILNVDINFSIKNFKVIITKNLKKIRYGFKGIPGLGDSTIKSILKTRKKKKFKNFLNFYKRIDKTIVNYKSIEILICSGCFDSLNQNRGNLIKKLEILSNINLKNRKNIDLIKNVYFIKNFFWNFKDKLIEERNVIGFFLINNFFNIYKKRFKKAFLKNFLKKGIIINIRDKINNKFSIQIVDEKDVLYEVIIKENLFKKNIKYIKKYHFILIKFKKNIKRINNTIFALNLININDI